MTINGYVIERQIKIDVGIVEADTDVNGTVYIQNAGSNSAYIDVKPGVDNAKWEIAAGEELPFPVSIKTLYHLGAGVTTLKLLVLKGV
jgi:hypothetical protein